MLLYCGFVLIYVYIMCYAMLSYPTILYYTIHYAGGCSDSTYNEGPQAPGPHCADQ